MYSVLLPTRERTAFWASQGVAVEQHWIRVSARPSCPSLSPAPASSLPWSWGRAPWPKRLGAAEMKQGLLGGWRREQDGSGWGLVECLDILERL